MLVEKTEWRGTVVDPTPPEAIGDYAEGPGTEGPLVLEETKSPPHLHYLSADRLCLYWQRCLWGQYLFADDSSFFVALFDPFGWETNWKKFGLMEIAHGLCYHLYGLETSLERRSLVRETIVAVVGVGSIAVAVVEEGNMVVGVVVEGLQPVLELDRAGH